MEVKKEKRRLLLLSSSKSDRRRHSKQSKNDDYDEDDEGDEKEGDEKEADDDDVLDPSDRAHKVQFKLPESSSAAANEKVPSTRTNTRTGRTPPHKKFRKLRLFDTPHTPKTLIKKSSIVLVQTPLNDNNRTTTTSSENITTDEASSSSSSSITAVVKGFIDPPTLTDAEKAAISNGNGLLNVVDDAPKSRDISPTTNFELHKSTRLLVNEIIKNVNRTPNPAKTQRTLIKQGNVTDRNRLAPTPIFTNDVDMVMGEMDDISKE